MTHRSFGFTSKDRLSQIGGAMVLLALFIIGLRSIAYSVEAVERGDIFIALLCVALSAAAFYLLKHSYKKLIRMVGQSRRDEIARSTFIKVRSGEIQRFSIFLRPFYITDRIYVKRTPNRPYYSYTIRYFLEDQIVAALGKSIPVVALGEPGETAGVGRILVDEHDWESAVYDLINRALFIILVPSDRKGTRLEIDYIIKNGFVQKTVFIMPPHEKWLFKWKKLRQDWERISEYLRNNGIELPSYRSCGLLFRINPGGECVEVHLDITEPKELRKLISRLVSVKI